MVSKRSIRRAVVAALVVGGAVLLVLSPAVPLGLLPFALGLVLEALGMALERR